MKMKKFIVMAVIGLFFLSFMIIPGMSGTNESHSKRNTENPLTSTWEGYYSSYTFFLKVNNSSNFQSFILPVDLYLVNFNTGSGSEYHGDWTFNVGENIINSQSFEKNGFTVNPFGSENSIIYLYTPNAKPTFQISYPNAYFTIDENGIAYSLYGGVLFGMYSVANASSSNSFNGSQSFSGFTSQSVENDISLSFQASTSGYISISNLTIYSQITISKNGINTTDVIQTEKFQGSISFFVPKNSKIEYKTYVYENGGLLIKKDGNITMKDQSQVIYLNISSPTQSFIGLPLVDIGFSLSLFFGILGGLLFFNRSNSLFVATIPMGISLMFFWFVGWLPMWVMLVYGGFALTVLFIFRDTSPIPAGA